MTRKQETKQLRQFWTPPTIADFMFELVNFDPLWKVIDPACGEGVFLLKAVQRGCIAIAGIDIDPHAIEQAKLLLKSHLSKVRLYCQDGLKVINDENAFWRGDYDLVIGNPPFAATGYRVRNPQILERFELGKVTVNEETLSISGQRKLFELKLERQRLKTSQAIEVLFLERFVQLCKQGGKVCIILPEGIFSNSSLSRVREWLVKNFTIQAVIGLPRDTFKVVGTTAKTVILYLEKRRPEENQKTFLTEVPFIQPYEPLDEKHNPALVAILRSFHEWKTGKVTLPRRTKPPRK